ncbi:MAG TPA: hypothetical protein VFO93_04945 [Hymenobacter sp.]|uniref:hypothetical protein n=1 Tax=Hymenobacter sp. TaxID=1898978 RepID=UPI002D807171|nr:hypothetical protein [Hymenobacter sp.]HET9502864.1 hypothetical protein [Hymenobacter sp.]
MPEANQQAFEPQWAAGMFGVASCGRRVRSAFVVASTPAHESGQETKSQHNYAGYNNSYERALQPGMLL